MVRQIIHIDESKCDGCGLCASACHEGAIAMVNGKAKLVRDDYCDGMGDCLPACPTGAITFEEREAAEYNRAAVEAKMAADKAAERGPVMASHGASKILDAVRLHLNPQPTPFASEAQSQRGNWPVQIKLAPVQAPYFNGAKLLIAADCTAFSYGNFHNDFLKGRVALIGCPKLDAVDYSEKLAEIIRNNDIESVMVVRMQVPCCGGLAMAVKRALQASGKMLPWQIVTIGMDGQVLD